MLSQEQAERMRKATAIRVLKQMSLEEIDSTLQALKDDNGRLREAVETTVAVKDLWLPAVVNQEHAHEAETLHKLHDKLLGALK